MAGGSFIPKGAVRIPCCQCIGGPGQAVPIITGPGAGAVAWKVSGPGVTNPIPQTVTSNLDPLWNGALPPAQWVQPNGSDGEMGHAGGVFSYRATIYVPDCVIPMSVQLVGNAAGDDEVKVYLDTTLIGQTPFVADPSLGLAGGVGGWGFRAARRAWFSNQLTPGIHVLRFDVTNAPGSKHGLMVRAAIQTVCSKELERPSRPLEEASGHAQSGSVLLP